MNTSIEDNKAAEAARKLASSTNTYSCNAQLPGAHAWSMPYGFNPYVPPPMFSSYNQYATFGSIGFQGMSFSNDATVQSQAIPQMTPPPPPILQPPPVIPAANSLTKSNTNKNFHASTDSQSGSSSSSFSAYGYNINQFNKPQNQYKQYQSPSVATGSAYPWSSQSSTSSSQSQQSETKNSMIGNSSSGQNQSSQVQARPKSENSNNISQTQQNVREPSKANTDAAFQKWPPSLQLYVDRCFSLCANDVDKDRVEIILKGKITRAASEGILQTKDWTLEPLPMMTDGRASLLPFAPALQGKIQVSQKKPVENGKGINDQSRGRGGGRGRGRGRGADPDASRASSPRKEKIGRKKPSRGVGGRGARTRFRCRSSSPSRFRSRSSSKSRSRSRRSSGSSRSSSSGSDASYSHRLQKRRKRELYVDSSSSSPDRDRCQGSQELSSSKTLGTKLNQKLIAKARRALKNKLKKANKSNEKNAKTPHIYSEFGQMRVEEECISNDRMNARAARFAKENASKPSKVKAGTMRSRLGGFVGDGKGVPWAIDTNPANNKTEEETWELSRVVGTCTDLEKRYLRLTTAPDAASIRPIKILKKSLELVKSKWKQNQDYFYACDQLKSIRQDLTVQRIRNDFTLGQLYKSVPEACANKVEFTGYRILYYIFTANTLDLGSVMASLSPSDRENECIRHALNLRSAWALGNYSKFFKLYGSSPKMSGYLIDWFANRERKYALKVILKSYRPHVSTDFVKEQLGFTLDSDWQNFLTTTQLESSVVYVAGSNRQKINAKESSTKMGT
ncbi:unnamed protein product [Allacma fusca]|uniref:SAC3/GANP/THP3 conserved domain-containing protein n=1 Tax=Allacma fusca TaxID=39272 RepID=A0A8J2LHY2_9HEXA|nr:unnamed protein product [Allacma fusca]